MRIAFILLAAVAIMACTSRLVMAQTETLPEQELLSLSALQSPASDIPVQEMGTTAGATGGILVPSIDAEPNLPDAEPSLSTLKERLDELSTKFEASTIPKKISIPTVKLTGFTHFDSAWYSQSPRNIDTVGDAQDGSGFRRVRVAIQGRAAEWTNYQVEADFANAGRPSFFDTYAEQERIPYLGTVRAGHFLQPFSVDAMTGFRSLPFLERSLPFLAFVPFRRLGIMGYGSSEDQMNTWGYSVFRTGGFNNAPIGDSRIATDIGDVGGYSFSTRATHLVWYDDDGKSYWHIGGGYDFSELGANDAVGSGAPGNGGSPQPFYQARVNPEFGPIGMPENPSPFGSAVNGTPVMADTGRFAARYFNLFGLETVYQNGPLTMQAEWMGTMVESVVGPVFYHGAYGEVMYRLTGEHREYDKKFGAMKNPIPFTDFISTASGPGRGIQGWGAWEIAARWSFVDLSSPSKLNGHYYDPTTNSFTGNNHAGSGSLNESTVGISWFVNANTKLQTNWICSMLSNDAKGFSTANVFVGRIQVSF